uniref:Uncharacterized protein n=1 Tax=Trichobilharzia regenti TaxID=157069 RepID=A0AA85J3T3_TRIRE|nr:unnamed protein product [Trichobilharzia regenti]
MGGTSKSKKPGAVSADVCYLRYWILTSLMVLLTIIVTLYAATVPSLRELCEGINLPIALFVLGTIPMGVFLLAKNVQQVFPLNYVLVILAIQQIQ